jgi:hypothetical protein
MREAKGPAFVAEFRSPSDLTDAIRRAHDEGFPPLDALSPYPVEGLDEALGLPKSPIRWPMLIFAVSVATLAYALQYWSAVYAYPIHSGGRPLNSWPIFPLVPFEVGILAAGIAGFAALLALCGLPRVNHPLFDWDAIERATDDRYFLLVGAPAEASESLRLQIILAAARAIRVRELSL